MVKHGPIQDFIATLTQALGADPATLDWPQALDLSAGIPAIMDPQNALLTIYGARPDDFGAGGLLLLPPKSGPVLDWCTRIQVLARPAEPEAWLALGFRPQGCIPGYWADGAVADVWAAMWGERREVQSEVQMAQHCASTLTQPQVDWICRLAYPVDAVEIRALMGVVFPGYRIPDDPGVIRYALARGATHGRVIYNSEGRLLAYAAAEFQPGQGAVEVTDCATEPSVRGCGLMTHLVGRLQEDLVDVFDGRSAYALAREDEPAMQKVFENLGWRQTGRLVNHFRVGGRWLSVNVWSA